MAGKDEDEGLAGAIILYGFLAFMGGMFLLAAWKHILLGLMILAFFGIAYLIFRYIDPPDA